ncbi:hypothetical protein [Dactylosporangium sp. CA-139066]|uniref:hypothetical protein n=1 Tax=Dactylosporangium sp. CA-139066 TaxID=3239930 RepID=UPI003D89BC4B
MRSIRLCAVAAAFVLAGCGNGGAADPGAASAAQAFVEYRPAGGEYAISVPPGWARAEAGASVTFTDQRDTITVDLGTASAAPNVSGGEDELEALRGKTRGFADPTVSVIERPAGQVLLVTYRADAPPDAAGGQVVNDDVERYEYWRAPSALLTVTLAAPHGSDNVDTWRTVTESVRWLA